MFWPVRPVPDPDGRPDVDAAPCAWCAAVAASTPAGGTSGSSPAITARSSGVSPVGVESGLHSSSEAQSVGGARLAPPPENSEPACSKVRCRAVCAATIQRLITVSPRRRPASSQVRPRVRPNAPARTGAETPEPDMETCAVAASATQSAAKTTARSERIRSVITMTLIVAPASADQYRTLRYWPVPPL